MAETSFWWTTSGSPAGHQVSSYTQSHLSTIAKILAGVNKFEGVAPAYLSALAGSIPANRTFRVASGGAVVDGKIYQSDANVDIDIPPTGADFRIDRIVIRVVWASFTAVLFRIPGVQSSSPTPPAITQTPGSTYDLMLFQVRVNSSGTVTIEVDERTWAAPKVDSSTIEQSVGTLQVKDLGITTAKINNLAVTSGKLAANAVIAGKLADGSVETAARLVDGVVTSGKIGANAVIAGKLADGSVDTTARLANDIVDDTKVGNRVAQAPKRQGGSSTDWAVGGTTTYTPTMVAIEMGSRVTGSISAGGSEDLSITFPASFNLAPVVVASVDNQTLEATVQIYGTQDTWFHAIVRNKSGSAGTFTVHWIAIGEPL